MQDGDASAADLQRLQALAASLHRANVQAAAGAGAGAASAAAPDASLAAQLSNIEAQMSAFEQAYRGADPVTKQMLAAALGPGTSTPIPQGADAHDSADTALSLSVQGTHSPIYAQASPPPAHVNHSCSGSGDRRTAALKRTSGSAPRPPLAPPLPVAPPGSLDSTQTTADAPDNYRAWPPPTPAHTPTSARSTVSCGRPSTGGGGGGGNGGGFANFAPSAFASPRAAVPHHLTAAYANAMASPLRPASVASTPRGHATPVAPPPSLSLTVDGSPQPEAYFAGLTPANSMASERFGGSVDGVRSSAVRAPHHSSCVWLLVPYVPQCSQLLMRRSVRQP